MNIYCNNVYKTLRMPEKYLFIFSLFVVTKIKSFFPIVINIFHATVEMSAYIFISGN